MYTHVPCPFGALLVTLCQIFSKRFLNGKGDMSGASPLFTLRKPWPQNSLSEVPERPVGPGVGYFRICTAVARTITLRAERGAVYQAMETGRLLKKVI